MKYKAVPRRYAEGTTVTVDKSRQELELLLRQRGAAQFGYFEGDTETVFVYCLHGRRIKHTVVRPIVEVKRLSKGMTEEEAQKARSEKEYQRRWRALLLLCKAKFEMIEAGSSTFEAEFLGDTMLPDGSTVGQLMLPRVETSYKTGEMPRFLLGSGE